MYQPRIMTDEEGGELLRIARNVLSSFVRNEGVSKPSKYPEKFNEIHGIFCTILKDGQVRGRAVVGLPYPLVSVIDGVVEAIKTAAHEDLRFTRVTPDELDGVKIELSLLTEPQKIDASSNDKILSSIIPGTDGLMLAFGPYEAFLPPQAWTTIGDKEQFMNTLCSQAGIEEGAWRDAEISLYKFQAQVFREE